MKILAVDDDPYILELMPLLGAKLGFPDITTARSGEIALEALESHKQPFDCLILDINMPAMDGIELCRQVRQVAKYRQTPIVMLTAMSERHFMDAAFKAGATDYATKPFDISELGARLRIAQELVVARRAVEEAEVRQLTSGERGAQANRLDLFDHGAVEGVAELVEFESLKNYLKQSSRAGLAASQVIAVKVDRVKELYDRASAEEFKYALAGVGRAIVDATRTIGSLIAYAGNGVFIIVSNVAAPLASSDIESDIQILLDEANAEYDSGAPMDIEVSIGNPLHTIFGDVSDVPASVERAIARAESRSMARPDQPRPVHIRLVKT